MDVLCDKCKTKFNIPDKKLEKLPKGKVFSVPCPKCKEKISVKNQPAKPSPAKDKPEKAAPPPKSEKAAPKAEKPPPKEAPAEDNGSDDEDSPSDNPFDFLEEGTQTVLLCETDDGIRTKVRAALEKMEYHISEPRNHREALKQMRFHDFDLVVINERFGTRDPDMNHILKHLEQLPMVSRRNLFIALLSERFRTMDNMMTFNKSVNLIVSIKDIDRMQKILERAVKDNDTFYRVFKECLEKIKG
ncbi:hypothetical protein QUF80_16015 [Desulfococcaceae bacterium HSG8]|nr:hypothetical protein [Desulfococcaceae bacterium HSG8]